MTLAREWGQADPATALKEQLTEETKKPHLHYGRRGSKCSCRGVTDTVKEEEAKQSPGTFAEPVQHLPGPVSTWGCSRQDRAGPGGLTPESSLLPSPSVSLSAVVF